MSAFRPEWCSIVCILTKGELNRPLIHSHAWKSTAIAVVVFLKMRMKSGASLL
jgi:hypothetical protein